MSTVEILNNQIYSRNELRNTFKKIVNVLLCMYLRRESNARAKGGERGGEEKVLALALESPYLLLLILVPRRLLIIQK